MVENRPTESEVQQNVDRLRSILSARGVDLLESHERGAAMIYQQIIDDCLAILVVPDLTIEPAATFNALANASPRK